MSGACYTSIKSSQSSENGKEVIQERPENTLLQPPHLFFSSVSYIYISGLSQVSSGLIVTGFVFLVITVFLFDLFLR